MKHFLILIGGLLMAPICFFLFVYTSSFAWFILPQALTVMFVRQSQTAYDSLGAPGWPDLVVCVLYYPIVGWILSRATRSGNLLHVAARIIIWHLFAMILAVITMEIRNHIWRMP